MNTIVYEIQNKKNSSDWIKFKTEEEAREFFHLYNLKKEKFKIVKTSNKFNLLF